MCTNHKKLLAFGVQKWSANIVLITKCVIRHYQSMNDIYIMTGIHYWGKKEMN